MDRRMDQQQQKGTGEKGAAQGSTGSGSGSAGPTAAQAQSTQSTQAATGASRDFGSGTIGHAEGPLHKPSETHGAAINPGDVQRGHTGELHEQHHGPALHAATSHKAVTGTSVYRATGAPLPLGHGTREDKQQ
jgi:hypothetical protein